MFFYVIILHVNIVTKFSANELTFDHLIPRCLHGKTTWTNVVSACTNCNLRKGQKVIKIYSYEIKKEPIQPTSIQLQIMDATFP